ncbi:MAG: carboxypeptidase regulatory-like domain-containing protein [Deltaproteobacteria bacterium]|nr:carboxypeptidase regulatory-like domain-containing protein [Deltaproteobacteria bacterium]
MKTIRFSGAILLAVLLASPAFASVQTGQVEVYVSGQDGMPVAGVKLTLSGKNLIGKRVVTSNEDGEARFKEIPPGTYSVGSEHDLFRDMTTEGIEVQIGRTATLDLILEPPVADEAEAVVVKGKIPMVDVENTTTGEVVTTEFANTVPTGRSYQSIANLTPGVSGGGGNPNVAGSKQYSNQYLLDGVNITDPVTNTFSANFNFDAMESVEVLTGGRDAEYGQATGGILNIVTKSGSNEHHVDGSIYYEAGQLSPYDDNEIPQDNTIIQSNVNLGGPVMKDKLWYFISAELPYAAVRPSRTSEQLGIFPDQEGLKPPPRTFFGLYALGKLTFMPTPTQTYQLLFQTDPTSIRNTKQQPTTHPDAERRQWQAGITLMGNSKIFLQPQMLWNTSVSFKSQRLYITPVSLDLDTSGHTNIDTGTDTINDTQWVDDKRYRLQLYSALSYDVDDMMGRHQFKAGIDASMSWNSVFQSIPGGEYFTDSGVDPNDPNAISGAGLPYRKTELVEAQDNQLFGDIVSVFAQDVWKPFGGLTVRPGLRFDSSRMRNYEGEAQIIVNTVSPRLGLAWDPFGDKKTAIRAGYYQYVDTGYLALSDFAGAREMRTRTWQYNPITEEYDIFLYSQGGSDPTTTGKDYLKEPFNQQRPRAHEFILGLSRELVDDLSLSADLIYKTSVNVWEDDEVNVIWNEQGDAVVGYVNGEPNHLYSLGALEGAWNRYIALQLTLNKRLSKNWQMMASYVLSKSDGTSPDYSLLDVAFDRPRQREFEQGLLPGHHAHVLKVYTSYKLPKGISIGGEVYYQSGGPYNRYYFNSFFSDYWDRRSPRGYDYDAEGNLVPLRMPALFTLAARIGWDLEELTGQKIQLYYDVFNLLNNRAAVAYETRNLPAGGATQFGDVIDTLDPLSMQFGLRFRY